MLKNFVFENIPKDWMMQSKLKGVNKNTSWTEVLAFLQTCEKYFKKGSLEKNAGNMRKKIGKKRAQLGETRRAKIVKLLPPAGLYKIPVVCWVIPNMTTRIASTILVLKNSVELSSQRRILTKMGPRKKLPLGSKRVSRKSR